MSEPTYYAKIVDDIVEGIYVADAGWVAQQDGVWIESTVENPAYQGAPVVDGLFVQPIISED